MNMLIEQINSMGRGFADFAGSMFLQSSVLVVILLVVDFLIRRKVRAVFRYCIWMLILVKLVLPTTLSSPVSLGFLLPMEFPTVQVSEMANSGTIQTALPEKAEQRVSAPISSPAVQPLPRDIEPVQMQKQVFTVPAAITWQGVVFAVWMIVAIVMLLLLLQRAMFVRGLLAQAKEASGVMNDTFRFCLNQMGMSGKIGLKISPNATSPAVCGLFRPVILVPQELGPSIGANQLRMVLLHELAHVKRGDLWVNFVQTLLQIIYFYNPFLWFANWVIRRVREQAVDEMVLVVMGEKAEQYPETLVNIAKLAFTRPTLSLRLIGVVESKSALAQRVKHMLIRPIPKTAKLGIAGLLTVFILGAVLLPMSQSWAGEASLVVKGRVADAVTGKPITGAKVGDDNYAWGKQNAVTDSNGNYSYLTWYEEHNIKAEATGYKSGRKALLTKLSGSEKEKILDFALIPEKKKEGVEEIVLGPDEEEYIKSLNLTSPDVIRDVRLMLQRPEKITSKMATDTIRRLMTDSRPEAKKAAADLLASPYGFTKILIIRSLPAAGDQTEYFMTKIVEFWGNLEQKDKRQLERTLPRVFRANKGNAAIEKLTDEIVVLMISDSGKTVPLAGIEIAKELNLKSDKITAALEKQKDNPIYDYFANEHPVRKATLEMLGEKYVPPKQEQIDFSKISVAQQKGLKKSEGLTVGVLTSLYTATGPCISSNDAYGWYGQTYVFPILAKAGINSYVYFHPITKVEETPLCHHLWTSGLNTSILNSASSYDLSMCDVIILSDIRNIRAEVVDALEDFVWNGGGIITLDGAGIVSCLAPKKFAALQDMRDLEWAWSRVADQKLIQTKNTPLMDGVDLSLPVDYPGRAFERNGYRFSGWGYKDQILLRFAPDDAAALRVGTYGAGRVAHFGWIPRFGSDEIGQRNWELLHRVILWAAGSDYEDLRPEPAYSKERYQESKGIFGRILNAERGLR